tara:strand:+ start:140 stop:808 length:669 start_codon:yes stop_codon:yes gene_type:complete
LYDGNIEVKLSNSKRFVIAHTNKYVNYEFWSCLLADAHRLSVIANHFSPIESENIFDILQKQWPKYSDPFVRSAMFYLLNRSSDLSYVSSGKLLEDEKLQFNTNEMSNFCCENMHVQLDKEKNFINSVNNISDKCDYVFMPIGKYTLNLLDDGLNEGLEQTKINHKDINLMMHTTNKKIVLLYNFSESVMEHYKDFNCYIIDQWGRNTEVKKFAKEVLIANF